MIRRRPVLNPPTTTAVIREASAGAAFLRTGRHAILSDESSAMKSDPQGGDPCVTVELGVAQHRADHAACRLDRPIDPLWQQYGHRIFRFLAEDASRDLGSALVELAWRAVQSKTRLSMSATDQPKSRPSGPPGILHRLKMDIYKLPSRCRITSTGKHSGLGASSLPFGDKLR